MLLRGDVSGKSANSVQNVDEILLQLNLQRSLFAVRRLKAWLRSSMTQIRLTHLALMHVHQKILDSVDIIELMTQFIEKTPERKAAFGSV